MKLTLHRPTEIIEDEKVVSFMEKIHKLDVEAYSPEDAGETQPMVDRYKSNPETYIWVTDEDADGAVIGYLNFFPVNDELKEKIFDPGTEYKALDDGITPGQIVPFVEEHEHFIYILSLVIAKKYRGGDSIKLLTNAFTDFLYELHAVRKCRITGIGACAVSDDGMKVLGRFGFNALHEVKDHGEEPGMICICDNTDGNLVDTAGSLSRLIYASGERANKAEQYGPEGSYYVKTWKDDVYLYLPMTEHAANTYTDELFKNSAVSGPMHFEPLDEDQKYVFYDESIHIQIMEALEESIRYECNSQAVRDMRVHFLGCYDFLHTTDLYPCIDKEFDPVHDDYLPDAPDESCNPDESIFENIYTYEADGDEEGEAVTGLQKGYVFITSHRPTHMYVVNVFFPDYKYSTTQLEDQVSNNYLKIVDPRYAEDAGPKRFIRLYDYLWSKYLLHRCGQEKIMLCMSGKPDTSVYKTEFQNVLSAEAYNSLRQSFHICSSKLREQCETDHSQYDYYKVYLSDRVIAFIPDEFGELEDRVGITATYSFIAELVMFQNTSLARMNMKVSDALYRNDDVTMEEVKLLEQEYGRTIPFFAPGNFCYQGTAAEAGCIKEAFSNYELLDAYNKNQEYLEHMADLISDERENRNSVILNIAATILAIIQVESFITEILVSFYEKTGIQIASEYIGFEKTFSHTLLGGTLFLIIYLILRGRKHNRDMKRRR